MKDINWGIIGTGKIAHTFATALKGVEGVNLSGVASRTLKKAQSFADEFGFEKAYGSYEELACDSDIDVVYIATPMASHYGDAMLCIKNGKNVLCEKSVALNVKETKEMIGLSYKNNVFFMEAMWMKCRPVYMKVLEWIKDGKIGKVEYIKADFSNFVNYDKNDRLFNPECGGGALLDLSVYPLTFADGILGGPDEIISSAQICGGIDVNNTILLKYGDKQTASMSCGFRQQLNNNALVSGSDGFIVLGDWFLCTSEATLFDSEWREVEKFICEPEINGYEYEIREVCRCLNEGLKESSLVPHEGTLRVMKVMDECRRQWGMKFPRE